MNLGKYMGMSRPQIIEELEKETQESFTKKEIIHLINHAKKDFLFPKELKIGDVFFHYFLKHPQVIIKIKDNLVYSLSLTTDKDYCSLLGEYSTRFSDSLVTTTFLVTEMETAKKGFLHPGKSIFEINVLKKKYKDYINDNL